MTISVRIFQFRKRKLQEMKNRLKCNYNNRKMKIKLSYKMIKKSKIYKKE